MLGTPCNFGFTGTDGIAATEFTGKIILQSADHEMTSDEEQIRDATGALVTRNFYNPGDKATLEYIPTGAAISNAVTNTALPAIGAIINITACASMPSLQKSNWVVVPGGRISGSNTAAKKITLNLEAYSEITAAAT
jgi:hypothetical protein